MRRQVRALLVEDSADDAMLVQMQLRRAGFDVVSERVDNAADLDRALSKARWDVVLSDHSMPQFSSDAVLRLLQERRLDVPCIIVSGRIKIRTEHVFGVLLGGRPGQTEFTRQPHAE